MFLYLKAKTLRSLAAAIFFPGLQHLRPSELEGRNNARLQWMSSFALTAASCLTLWPLGLLWQRQRRGMISTLLHVET